MQPDPQGQQGGGMNDSLKEGLHEWDFMVMYS